LQPASLFIIKKYQRREDYSRDKLLSGIRRACEKRPLPTGSIEKLVDEIEAGLFKLGKAEIPSTLIGDMVMEKLKALDYIAYIRFASVYREFADIRALKEAVDNLVVTQKEALVLKSEALISKSETSTNDSSKVKSQKSKLQPKAKIRIPLLYREEGENQGVSTPGQLALIPENAAENMQKKRKSRKAAKTYQWSQNKMVRVTTRKNSFLGEESAQRARETLLPREKIGTGSHDSKKSERSYNAEQCNGEHENPPPHLNPLPTQRVPRERKMEDLMSDLSEKIDIAN
jgi:transcriptional repressor NrdR